MEVDIAYIGSCKVGIVQGILHCSDSPLALWMRGSRVIGVATQAATKDLTVRMFRLLVGQQ